MNFATAEEIFRGIDRSATDPASLSLKRSLLEAAVRYARIRTDWALADSWKDADADTRKAKGASRRAAHDAFIDSCNSLSRYLSEAGTDISWRAKLGTDRREIGDFACYLHCLLGLRGA